MWLLILANQCHILWTEPSKVEFFGIIGGWLWRRWHGGFFMHLGKAAFDPWPQLSVFFSRFIANLRLVLPPLPLLPIPHHLCMSLLYRQMMRLHHHHVSVDSQYHLIARGVRKYAPTEWYLNISIEIYHMSESNGMYWLIIVSWKHLLSPWST